MRFEVKDTPLQGVSVLVRRVFKDQRGSLDRLFGQSDFLSLGLDTGVSDVNVATIEEAGTIKGLHLQKDPFSETKVVTCLAGAVFDVAVDVRAGSPTRGQWFGLVLRSDVAKSLVIPRGFAHGVQALEENCLVHYLHSAPYSPKHEVGFHALDPILGIDWPMKVSRLSLRDSKLPNLGSVKSES